MITSKETYRELEKISDKAKRLFTAFPIENPTDKIINKFKGELISLARDQVEAVAEELPGADVHAFIDQIESNFAYFKEDPNKNKYRLSRFSSGSIINSFTIRGLVDAEIIDPDLWDEMKDARAKDADTKF